MVGRGLYMGLSCQAGWRDRPGPTLHHASYGQHRVPLWLGLSRQRMWRDSVVLSRQPCWHDQKGHIRKKNLEAIIIEILNKKGLKIKNHGVGDLIPGYPRRWNR